MKETRERIIRSKAAEILECNAQGVSQYVQKRKLHDAGKIDGCKAVYFDEVMQLKAERDTRKQRQAEKQNARIYKGVPNQFYFQAILDPTTDDGRVHIWLIDENAFGDLVTGTRTWDQITPAETYLEIFQCDPPLPTARKMPPILETE